MGQMKVIMIHGMNRIIVLKDRAEELRELLKEVVYNQFISNSVENLKSIDVLKMDNDLSYISLISNDSEDLVLLNEYYNLLNVYAEQLEKFY